MKNIITLLFVLLLTSCSTTYKLSTINNDPLYGPHEVALEVPSDVQIDTLSYSQLRRKLRNDFNFRYDFAQYAMDQPYSWYTSNYSFSYWRPYTSFDIYWNRHQFWNDWAFNYPFFNYGFNHWNTLGFYGYGSSFGYYGFNSYGSPWNSWGYGHPFYNNYGWRQEMNNYAWHNRNRPNTAYINGRRASNSVVSRTNSNISKDIIIRNYKGRNSRTIDNSNENSTLNIIVSNLREKFNNVRVYTKPNNVPTNNGRPVIISNNSNIKYTPRIDPNNNNSNNNNSYKPVNNTSTRPSYNISRGGSSSVGSSRGGTSSSSNTSGGSSRGGVKNN